MSMKNPFGGVVCFVCLSKASLQNSRQTDFYIPYDKPFYVKRTEVLLFYQALCRHVGRFVQSQHLQHRYGDIA